MKNKSVVINTGANFICRVWTIIANFIFVPVFINYLGLESYGLVTFFTTLQILLYLLGLGLSKTLRREFAADERSGKDTQYKYKILRTIEVVYWLICIVILLICFFSADYISTQWLQASGLSSDTISSTILLMGGCIASQLLANLYLGCLFGLEKQVEANSLQVCWSISRNIGVILVLALVKSDILHFYFWFLLCDMVYFILVRFRVVLHIRKVCTLLVWSVKDLKLLKGVYKYALGLMVVSIGYCINTQLDKIILSGKFDLITVGAYNTVYSLSILSTIISTAVGIAIFPKFTSYFTIRNKASMQSLYIDLNCFVNIVTISLGCFLSAYSTDLLIAWTGSPEISNIVGVAAPLIILGTTINALQEITYNYLLACGVTIVNNVQTVFSISYVIIIMPVLINKFGINGAAFSWLSLMLISTILYLLYFNAKYIKSNMKRNILRNTMLPFFVALVLSFLSRKAITFVTSNVYAVCAIGVMSGLITILTLIVLLYPTSQYKGVFKCKNK